MGNENEDDNIVASGRRWPIIFIFACYSLSSAFQWIEFAIVPNVFQTYYDVGLSSIMWTSQIYMATFIPLVFPAMMLIDNTGLKNIALIGSGANAIGALVKCFGLGETMWPLVFFGQTISACAQCFILELPPKIASIWFPSNEISTATSLGVFGNQLGVALGFLIPPLIIQGPRTSFIGSVKPGSNETYQGHTYPDNWKNSTAWSDEVVTNAISEVRYQIQILYWSFAALCILLFILVIFIFRDKPPRPANRASIRRQETKTESTETGSSSVQSTLKSYMSSISTLLKDIPFLLLTLSYGLNVGVYYALSSLLNQLIKPTFQDDSSNHGDDFMSKLDKNIGLMGTIMVCAGLVGSLVGGVLLDMFKKYKLTTLATYICSLLFMALFTLMLGYDNLHLDFFFIAVLGFFMTGYLPIGFEFAAEITFPISEASSSGILNCSAQIFGLLVTEGCTRIVSCWSEDGCISTTTHTVDYDMTVSAGKQANMTMIVCLVVGSILTFLIKEDLKRQRAENETVTSGQTEGLLQDNSVNA